jgi:hypothetical protein
LQPSGCGTVAIFRATVSFALEAIPDTIPLTNQEKVRKKELESIVSDGLETLLKVGKALGELRNLRLYRVEFPTFEQYVRSRFGLARSSADQLIRSSQVAQSLIESGCALPANVTEAVIRPIASLPDDDDLRSICWQLAESFAPERGPTTRLVARLCSVVRECLENPTKKIVRKDARGFTADRDHRGKNCLGIVLWRGLQVGADLAQQSSFRA